METRSILILLGLLASTCVLADAYTWTDEDGIVHYSDRPHPGAKKVDLSQATAGRRPTTNSRRSAAQAAADSDENRAPVAFRYESLEVTSPSAEETLWNIEGTLNVSLALSPELRLGHQVRVYFDGTPQMVAGANFRLREVYRGTHRIQAEVIDAKGKLMIRSRQSTFYVQQNSVL